MKLLGAVTAAFFLLIWGVTGASAAEDAVCEDGETLPSGSYGNVTISGNCSLDESHVIEGDLQLVGDFQSSVIGTVIHGDVILDGGGWTNLIQVEVGGDVIALSAYAFGLGSSSVDGDVIAEYSGMIWMSVGSTRVGGSILIDSASGDGVELSGNTVGRDISLHRTGIQTIVNDNVIGRNLNIVSNGGHHPSSVQRNDVGGHVLIERFQVITGFHVPSEVLIIAENLFRKNVRILHSSGPIYLTDNEIGGVLQCRGNEAFFPEDNAAKNKIGQCRE